MSAADSLRTALSIRIGSQFPPGSWRAAAAAAGISDVDAFLCYLSLSIAAALDHLAASAEAVRAKLQSLREDDRVVDGLYCDSLESRIAVIEFAKRAALERELCAVDAVLDCFRSERGAVGEVVATVSDAELLEQYPSLEARLNAIEAQLRALPTSVTEPPLVELVIDNYALDDGIADFARIIAPLAVTAADLVFERIPSLAHPGQVLHLHLALSSATHSSQAVEELAVSLGAAASATHIEASLEAVGAAPQLLQSTTSVCVNDHERRVVISIVVPLDAPAGSSVHVRNVTVSGQSVAGLPDSLLVEPPGPAGLTPEQTFQLQTWLPVGSLPPYAWKEVYRATTHGFGAAAFHSQCDTRANLLVLVQEQERGWLFGGFTAVGFIPPDRRYADPAAFLFSLSNPQGRPEKLDSLQTGSELYYSSSFSAIFGPPDLCICDNANTEDNSFSNTGNAFAVPLQRGSYPMSRGWRGGWCAAEVVAWVVESGAPSTRLES